MFLHDKQNSKLDPKALKCMFIGYFTVKKGFKCYHPLTRKLYVTMDITFSDQKHTFQIPAFLFRRNLEDEGINLQSDASPIPFTDTL